MNKLSEARLFRLKLERSKASRDDALATVREIPGGWWQARIGGRMRGKTLKFASRARAIAAVQDHYNATLFRSVTRKPKEATDGRQA